MARKNDPVATRARLLQTATELIAAGGLLDLTLDHLAAAAGVSKGGLLHHFPTKLALLEGLVGSLAEQFDARLIQALASEPSESPGAWTRAYIEATFDTSLTEVKLMSALLAATGGSPSLLDTYQTAMGGYDLPPDDPRSSSRQVLVRLACDGLLLAEVSGTPTIDADLRVALRAELRRLSR